MLELELQRSTTHIGRSSSRARLTANDDAALVLPGDILRDLFVQVVVLLQQVLKRRIPSLNCISVTIRTETWLITKVYTGCVKSPRNYIFAT